MHSPFSLAFLTPSANLSGGAWRNSSGFGWFFSFFFSNLTEQIFFLVIIFLLGFHLEKQMPLLNCINMIYSAVTAFPMTFFVPDSGKCHCSGQHRSQNEFSVTRANVQS